MHVRNGSHKSMHNYNKILEEISDGLEVEKVFLGKAKSIIATIYYYYTANRNSRVCYLDS